MLNRLSFWTGSWRRGLYVLPKKHSRMKCQGYEIRFLSVQQIKLEMKAFRLKQGQGLKTSAANL